MLLLQKRLTAMLAACLFVSGVVPADALTNANPAVTTDVVATVTAHRGVVFKRDFTDFVKQNYGDPMAVNDMDKLREGMQIGTGNESWAEVQWPNVRTRAWANTVFSVAPNKRLVYLAGGEMLFRLDKNRPNKDQPYYIWTKVLQARIRGTTVLVQAKGNTTRFTVMEGVVDIWNRLDRSHVSLTPGVVYEVKGFDMSKQMPLPDLKSSGSTAEPAASTGGTTDSIAPYKAPTNISGSGDKSVHDITFDSQSFVPVFQDKYQQTNVYASNSHAIQNHPLVTSVNGPIDSLGLIQQAQRDLPGYNSAIPIPLPILKLADQSKVDRVIAKNVAVKGVPTNADWYVGKTFSSKVSQLAFVDLQPKGVVFNPNQVPAAAAPMATVPSASRVATFIPAPVLPVLTPYTGKTIDLDESVPAPVQEFAAHATDAISADAVSHTADAISGDAASHATGTEPVADSDAAKPEQSEAEEP
jgi:hypothetical protein